MRFTTKAVFLLLLLSGVSCKKKKTNKDPDPDVQPEATVRKKWLPVKMESDQLTLTFKYAGESGVLTDISASDGYATSITYKNDQPYQITKSKNQVAFELVDYVKTKDNEPKARSFDQKGNVYIPTGSYVLTYDDKTQLSRIKNYKDNGELLRERIMTYQSGNISSIRTTDYPETIKDEMYTIDVKNNIFKHVPCTDRLFLESRYFFLQSGPNNVTRISDPKSAAGEVIFSYLYNTDDYPSQLTVTKNNVKQVFKISYIELK